MSSQHEVWLELEINSEYYHVLFNAYIEPPDKSIGIFQWYCDTYDILEVQDCEYGEVLHHDNWPEIESVKNLEEKIFNQLKSDTQQRKDRIGY